MSWNYNHQELEKKWREDWDKKLDSGESNWIFDEEGSLTSKTDDMYLLDMFAYPSGSGLHVGHVEQRVALDIYARYLRMNGKNVLMPTGYDSFGLPTENYAIKNDMTPQVATEKATSNFDEQTKKLGISYDWTRTLKTSDPEYYKFTQWWFKFLYERGLAYRKKQKVNWCPKDQTVLANEQVIDGHCERCDTKVIQKDLEQWFFKITDYADRLLSDLDKLDWPESTKAGQRNWIGRSEGIEIDYRIPLYTGATAVDDFRSELDKPKILVATGNPKKLERAKLMIEGMFIGYEVVGLIDLGLERIEVEEGDDIVKNSLMKARVYRDKTDLPILAFDSALIMENADDGHEPAAVRRRVVSVEEEAGLTQKQIAERMIGYYKDLAEKHGGQIKTKFVDGIGLILPDGTELSAIGERRNFLTTEISDKFGENFPLNNIQKAEIFPDKFINQLTAEEELEYVRDTATKLADLISEKITVYTTRPDTNFGSSFIVVAPDSEFTEVNKEKFLRKNQANEYIDKSLQKTELERQAEGKAKTGEFTGFYAWNPLNEKFLPIFISDFVLSNVGTGCVVGVPGHDKRDFEFAQVKGLDVIRVVADKNGNNSKIEEINQVQDAEGKMVNSGFLDGLEVDDAKEKIKDYIEQVNRGRKVVNYKLRDWSISRQRYWGAPIPVIYKTEMSDEDKILQNMYEDNPGLVLNFHAWKSSSKGAYHEYIRDRLAELGIKYIGPEMPGDEIVGLDEWITKMNFEVQSQLPEIEDYSNTVVTGRSLGNWAALKFAELNKVRKLILVAPSTPVQLSHKPAQELVNQNSSSDAAWNSINQFIGGTNGNLDWDKVNENVSELVVYLSTDDDYIPLEQTETYFRENFENVRIIKFRDAGHFHKDDGYTEFPELVAEIIKPVRLDIQLLDLADLPVELPEDVDYRPQGSAPLATSIKFDESINTDKYGSGWKREVDTMDTFVDSSWYFFRFIDPRNSEKFVSPQKVHKVGAVDFYIGGAEHTVLHLLYARFFTKAAFDAGLIDFDEPFMKLRHQGLILAEDGRKMSKRWGNVVNPTDIVEEYGADTIRMYEMFMGPLDQSKAWDDGSVRGVRRFLDRIWETHHQVVKLDINADQIKNDDSEESKAKLTKLVEIQIELNQLVEKIAHDIKNLKFNTAVSSFMEFSNLIANHDYLISISDWKIFLKLFYPFAPFLSSELLVELDPNINLNELVWPGKVQLTADIEQKVVVVAMVNGKLRDQFEVLPGVNEDEILNLAKDSEKVMKFVGDVAKIKKKIFVKDKLINIVV